MNFSGFYMVNEKCKEVAKENTIKMYKDELFSTIKKLYGENCFEVTDIIREYKGGELNDETGECCDVHFILNLPEANNIEEDTELFYALEKIMCTGLSVIDEALLN